MVCSAGNWSALESSNVNVTTVGVAAAAALLVPGTATAVTATTVNTTTNAATSAGQRSIRSVARNSVLICGISLGWVAPCAFPVSAPVVRAADRARLCAAPGCARRTVVNPRVGEEARPPKPITSPPKVTMNGNRRPIRDQDTQMGRNPNYGAQSVESVLQGATVLDARRAAGTNSVSYTHLTLPTK